MLGQRPLALAIADFLHGIDDTCPGVGNVAERIPDESKELTDDADDDQQVSVWYSWEHREDYRENHEQEEE